MTKCRLGYNGLKEACGDEHVSVGLRLFLKREGIGP